MTPIQKLQIRMSETREKVNDLVTAESADDVTQRDKLSADLKALEAELRAAIEADGAASTSPEAREWDDLNSGFDLGEMFTNVIEHRANSGEIAEVQAERGLAANAIPTDMLMVEYRAVDSGTWRRGPEPEPDCRLRVPSVSGGFPGDSFRYGPGW